MRVLHAIAWVLGGVVGVLSAWVVIARLTHPVDAEWMTGTIREGVERVRDGKPLYVAPSAGFIPFVYPPLYFWLSALLARALPTALACKLVSITAAFGAGWGVHRIATALGATTRWARLGVVLFVATYPLTLFFYDLERVDALYAAMIAIGVAVLLTREGTAWTALAGVLLGGSFFAKQAGLFPFAAIVIALVVTGEKRRAGIVAAAGGVVLVALFAWLERSTGGMFRFYCLTLPSGHGIKAARLSLFFVEDVPRTFAYVAGTLAILVPVVRAAAKRNLRALGWKETAFGFVLFAGLAGAFSFRAHAGGWQNVLIAWLPLACVAIAIAASRAEEWAIDSQGSQHLVGALLLGGVCLQLTASLFDPTEVAPEASDVRERERLVTLVRTLEAQGPVMVTTVGQITKEPAAQSAALEDVLRGGGEAPKDLLDAFEQRRFAAILVGNPTEQDCGTRACDEVLLALGRNYFVAARRHDRTHTGTSGFDGRPRWILRPRKTPLVSATRAELDARQRLEMGLATAESAKTDPNAEVEPVDAIEQVAGR